MREEIFLSDDLYNESVHGYFATPKFHELLRDAFTSRPQGFRSGELEGLLDCHIEEFTAYLKNIVDDDGIAHVPIGDSECISLDLWDFVDHEEAAEACKKNRRQRALDRFVEGIRDQAILRADPAHRAKEKQEREQAETERREKLRQREAILDVVRARPGARLGSYGKLSYSHAFVDSLHAYLTRWTYRAATGDVLGYVLRLDDADGKQFRPLAPNGSKSGAKADWSALRGRDLATWRDAGGGTSSSLYLDLADSQWQTVKITATGRELLDAHDLPFGRSPRMRALCAPLGGNDPFAPIGGDKPNGHAPAPASPQWTLIAPVAPHAPSPPARHSKLGANSPRVNKGNFLQSFIGSGGAKAPRASRACQAGAPMKTGGAASIAASPPRVYRSCRRRRLATK